MSGYKINGQMSWRTKVWVDRSSSIIFFCMVLTRLMDWTHYLYLKNMRICVEFGFLPQIFFPFISVSIFLHPLFLFLHLFLLFINFLSCTIFTILSACILMTCTNHPQIEFTNDLISTLLDSLILVSFIQYGHHFRFFSFLL